MTCKNKMKKKTTAKCNSMINAQCNRTCKMDKAIWTCIENTYHLVCNNCSALNLILTSFKCSMNNKSEHWTTTNTCYRLAVYELAILPVMLELWHIELYFLFSLLFFFVKFYLFHFYSKPLSINGNEIVFFLCAIFANFFPLISLNWLLITKWLLTKLPLFNIYIIMWYVVIRTVEYVQAF